MRSPILKTVFVTSIFLVWGTIACAQSNWQGDWFTDRGKMSLKQSGNKVTGTYSKTGTVSGTVKGAELSVKFRNGQNSGTGTFTLASNKNSFEGSYKQGRGGGSWRGWRADPKVESRKMADYSGVWLTDWGTMQLEQSNGKITGKYGAQGWKTLEGEVVGGKMKFDWKQPGFIGKTEVEQSPDGKRFYGTTLDDKNPAAWIGIRLEGFDLHVKPEAGKMVEGRAKNGMLYFLRMPNEWKEGDKVDVVVLLHGSNWTTKGMVYITNQNWPEIGEKFAILGIQGENWTNWSDMDDLRFNYTYVNWVGRSTYGGYPYTDRESPYLVAQVLDELTGEYKFDRILIGGHSQGGYLTYVMHMNYPEKLAGSFPIAGGMIFQAEPKAFDDESLIESQKATPMVILHGKNDNVVPFSYSEYAFNAYRAHEFPNVKFSTPRSGHPYDFLPIGETIEWLDMMSTNDKETLAKYVYELAKKKQWRDVGTAIARAKAIDGGKPFAKAWQMYEDEAKEDAEKHLRAIEANKNSKWIDDYLKWQEKFYLTKAATELNEKFSELRSEHDEAAKELSKQAREAFNAGNQVLGWQKREEIVDNYYASKEYMSLKAGVEKRRKK